MKYVSLTKFSEERLRKDYINQHSRFIHSSWLLLEDLDKEVELYGRNYRIAGLWDTAGHKKIILLQNTENNTYAYTESKEIANAYSELNDPIDQQHLKCKINQQNPLLQEELEAQEK